MIRKLGSLRMGRQTIDENGSWRQFSDAKAEVGNLLDLVFEGCKQVQNREEDRVATDCNLGGSEYTNTPAPTRAGLYDSVSTATARRK